VASINQKVQDKNAESYSTANLADRAVAKSSTGYTNATWDLVDAAKDDKVDLKKLKKEELPEVMKDMDEGERIAYVNEKSSLRDTIKMEINSINIQRQTFIDEKKKEMGETNSLDKALIGSVRNVAEKKNYTFNKN
jgi:hypothetical protein